MRRTIELAFVLFVTSVAVVKCDGAQIDFESGNDSSFMHYDPLAQVGGTPASYTINQAAYANYGPSNHVYDIFDPASTVDPAYGPSRAGSLLEGEIYYSQFYAAVDLVTWETSHDEALGLLARITNPGLGTTDGYALTYSVGSTEIDLTRIDDESPTNLALTKLPALTPGHGYRLVFTGNGDLLTGQVFDDADLSAPLATITATDSTYGSGYSGLIVFDNTLSPATNGADATFDNYADGASLPEPASAGAFVLAASLLLRRRRLGSRLLWNYRFR